MVLFIFVFATFLIVNRQSRIYDEKIKKESISTRIFVIDAKNDSVIFFNRSDMKHKKKMNLSSFYFHFHSNDTEKVQQWIYSIIADPKGCDQYLEADILESKLTYSSVSRLLEVWSYDIKISRSCDRVTLHQQLLAIVHQVD